MSGSTLQRVYPYNHKTISWQTGSSLFPISYGLCNQKILLRMVPPNDFLEWKNMHMKALIKFNPASGISAADLKVVTVGVVQALPFPVDQVIAGKRITVNKSVPDAATTLELDIDLTTLISSTGPNWVEITMPPFFLNLSGWGAMLLWQLDADYTTKGIR